MGLGGRTTSEALGADIPDLEFERGHRTLKIMRKGGEHATIPLAPRTSRVLDLYIGERATGPILLGASGARLDRYAADCTVKAWPAERESPRSALLRRHATNIIATFLAGTSR